MEKRIDVNIIRDKSFDPVFQVKVSYQDENVSFKNALITVNRKPPKVAIEYPEDIEHLLPKVDTKKLELEIMNKIVEFLLSARRF